MTALDCGNIEEDKLENSPLKDNNNNDNLINNNNNNQFINGSNLKLLNSIK